MIERLFSSVVSKLAFIIMAFKFKLNSFKKKEACVFIVLIIVYLHLLTVLQ